MQIRFATEADLPELVSVQREVHELHRQLNPRTYREATNAELLEATREFLAADSNKAWVAVGQNGLSGYLLLKIETIAETALCHARKEATVNDVGVRADEQRQGTGRALLAEATRHAADQGCQEVRLTVLTDNTAARQFYEALGFDVFSQRLTKRL